MWDLSGLSCSEQWAALAETPRLMRWWHFISLSADNLQAGLVSGWAWYLAGASWRTAPAAAYACLGTLISFSVLLHGPAAKITHIGPFMGACQLYMAALPLFQPVHRVGHISALPLLGTDGNKYNYRRVFDGCVVLHDTEALEEHRCPSWFLDFEHLLDKPCINSIIRNHARIGSTPPQLQR